MKRLLILGTGALGTLFAERLAQSGLEVWVLGTWQAALDALNSRGACVEWPDDVQTCAPVRAVADPRDCPPPDAALVLVKAWQTERAARQLAAVLPADGVALTLQNGLGNAETLTAALGAERVALGVTTTGAALTAPGLVRFGGAGLINIGEHPRIAPLVAALQDAGLDVKVAPDAETLLWRKLAVNAAINPLTALLDVPNGRLLELPDIPALMDGLASEVAAVGRARGLDLDAADLAALARDVAARTAANHSSMLQDLRRGAPTEIDAICGAVTQLGEKVHIPTPLNRLFWQLVRAKAAKAGTIQGEL